MAKVLTCIVTGLEKKFTKSSIEKKLLKFGTLDNLEKYYVSKEARNLFRKHFSVEQIRSRYNTSSSFPLPSIEVLFKLKLLKKRKTKGPILSDDEKKQLELKTQENERKYYELKEKMSSCLKTWVEWATGGPDKSQVPYGGTCIRPDIYYDNEGSKEGRCKPCPYSEFCLCTNKEVR